MRLYETLYKHRAIMHANKQSAFLDNLMYSMHAAYQGYLL